jgi:hypothetical protein
MQRARDERGRLKPILTDAEVADARRRARSGKESIRSIARDLGLADHSGLARRIRALDARDAREQQLRLDSRAMVRDAIERGERPELENGQPVVVPSDLERETASAQALALQRHREREARAADEISPEEFISQKIEASDVAAGRRTVAQVRQERAAGRRPFRLESSRLSEPDSAGPIIFSPAALLAEAVRGRC